MEVVSLESGGAYSLTYIPENDSYKASKADSMAHAPKGDVDILTFSGLCTSKCELYNEKLQADIGKIQPPDFGSKAC